MCHSLRLRCRRRCHRPLRHLHFPQRRKASSWRSSPYLPFCGWSCHLPGLQLPQAGIMQRMMHKEYRHSSAARRAPESTTPGGEVTHKQLRQWCHAWRPQRVSSPAQRPPSRPLTPWTLQQAGHPYRIVTFRIVLKTLQGRRGRQAGLRDAERVTIVRTIRSDPPRRAQLRVRRLRRVLARSPARAFLTAFFATTA